MTGSFFSGDQAFIDDESTASRCFGRGDESGGMHPGAEGFFPCDEIMLANDQAQPIHMDLLVVYCVRLRPAPPERPHGRQVSTHEPAKVSDLELRPSRLLFHSVFLAVSRHELAGGGA
jgi:hypothetical protein